MIVTGTIFHFGQKHISLNITGPYVSSKTSDTATFETVFGDKELHKTGDATNCPATAIGYIHDYTANTLYAISSKTADKTTAGTATAPWTGTMTVVGVGKVKQGKHMF